MPKQSEQQGALRPAWLGIAGWALFLAAWITAALTPYPHNGQALVALALGVYGLGLVRRQTRGTAQ